MINGRSDDIKELLLRYKAAHVDYCDVCGGGGELRQHITGCIEIDFVRCGACNGTGKKKQLKFRRTEYERGVKPWIDSLEIIMNKKK